MEVGDNIIMTIPNGTKLSLIITEIDDDKLIMKSERTDNVLKIEKVIEKV